MPIEVVSSAEKWGYMKKAMFALGLAVILIRPAFAQDPGWPRKITTPQGTLVYYQPQVDNWQNFQILQWRMAFTITPAGGKGVVGAATMQGTTTANTSDQMVVITNIKVTNSYFPSSDPATAATLGQLLQTFAPQSTTVSLARIVASTPKTANTQGVQLNNAPPTIFVSHSPAILLGVEGQPVFEPVHETKLEYVVNTSWHLFREKENSQYFLLVDKQWLTAGNPEGPWSPVSKLPKDFEKMLKEPAWEDLKGVVPPPANSSAVVPTVFYSSSPADVILFNGQPQYYTIPGTQLVYATNSNSYLFVYSPTQTFYYLTAGRWFSANGLQGPWTYATESLPADFAKIPPSSPPGIILASVPGTDEAKDAVLIAQVPTTVTVNPTAAAAQAKVTYEGAPNFAPIQGTSLSYATNTSQRVIQVGDVYYLCLNGIWFLSASPQGPWQTAQSVPQQIYTIPPSSPVYNVTYVTQTTTSSGSVQSSYTAGYLGAFVMGAAVGAVVAGGTGYYYPPVYGAGYYGYPTYHPYPCTYGATPYYNTATGAYGDSQTAYGAYGSATRSASYNPYSGTYARSGSVSTPYGSAAAGQAYNPYTGAYGQTKQGSNAYGSWGSSTVSTPYGSASSQHQSNAYGSEGTVQTSAGGKAGATSSAYGSTAAGKTSSGNMYADHNGNVYKNTGSGWQSYNNGSWNSVNSQAQQHTESSGQQHPTSEQGGYNKSGGSGGGFNSQEMNQEMQNRQRGDTESQRSGGWGGGGEGGRWGGGGGSRGSYGGGGRRW
jgi:hypothetical protein